MNRKKNMRIGIDATLLQKGRYTGIENYSINLIKSLLKADKENSYILFFRKEVPNELENMTSSFEFMISPTSNRIFTDQIWMPWAIKKARIDLLHCPAFPSPVISDCRTILTIHDAVHWKYPKTLSKGSRYYYRHLFPQAIERAAKIITVSNSTKNDLIGFFPKAKVKIRVIYEAVDSAFFAKKRYKSCYEFGMRKYILTVGSIEPRKNLDVLLKAFHIVQQQNGADFKLVIVGRRAWLKKFHVPEEIKEAVIFTGYIPSKEDLAYIYQNAFLFVLPSIYEGFGLPVLEAMSAGTPVLCSNTSSLPEVAGDAAEYAGPNKPEEFSEKILKIINNESLRKQMVLKGYQRVRLFSWKNAAEETLSVYNEVQ